MPDGERISAAGGTDLLPDVRRETGGARAVEETVRTPDQRLRVFVSSTLGELADERRAVHAAVERLHLTAVMFELGARPHPPRTLYRAYLRQSHVFIGIYYQRYGFVAPGSDISGLEDEFRLSDGMPRLLYIKRPAQNIEPRLATLLHGLEQDARASYRVFADARELEGLVEQDLAALLSERFLAPVAGAHPAAVNSAPPVPLTPAVGRDDDIAAVVDLLDEGVRLLTITGPGGIGKSRFVLEVARTVGGRFADGVVFVPLERLTDPVQVLRAVALSLGVPDSGNRPILERLVDELAGRNMLLIIDNIEQVAAAGPDVAELLGRCPGVSALVTSRYALHLRGERVFHLDPLPVPATSDADAVAASPAVELFVQRAVAADRDFHLTEANRPAVAEVVRRLDGLPLAIELAAARTRVLPPAALLRRLGHRLDVLNDGVSDLPPRQRTLRATLDWSYHLLGPAEKALFTRMSAFAGGATFDAVEAVCADEAVPDAMGTLSSLVEKSLLISAGTEDRPRVHMLRTIRVRAAELLVERGESDAVRARHARYYAAVAEPADVLRHTRAPRHWPVLEAEIDNFRVAAEWAMADADGPLLADLARRLSPWLWSSGRVAELYEAVVRVSAVPAALTDPAQRGYLAYAAAYARGLTGDLAGAQTAIGRALLHLRHMTGPEKPLLVGAARLVRGTVRLGLGRTRGVDAELDAAVAPALRADNTWLLGYASAQRGLRRAMLGELAEARADHVNALAAAREMGHEVLVAEAIGQLAIVDVMERHLDDAWARLRAQVDHLKRSHSLEGLANALDTAAALAVAREQWPIAGRAASAAAAVRHRTGVPAWPLIREYHQASADRARRHLGSRDTPIAAEAARADPWVAVEEILAALHI